MRHNVKTSLWAALALLLPLVPASAAAPAALEVTAADLAAAGVPGVTEVAPAPDRFAAPVRYFRSPETLGENEAKKDCIDCGSLIAVYAAEASGVPNWETEKLQQFVRVGGRLQVRAYLPAKRRIVTVTAVSESTARKISAHLVAKFSK